MSTVDWVAWTKQLADEMQSHFATEDELRVTLSEAISHPSSPVTRARISIEARGNVVLQIDVGVGDAAGLNAVTPLEGGADDKVEVSAVPKLDVSSISMEEQQQVTNSLIGLANGYWNGRFRDSHAALPSRGVAGSPKLIEASVPFLVRSHRYLSSMFIDIDGFHDYNRQYGEAQGDLLIGLVGRTIALCAGAGALAILRSGDEFIVLAGVNCRDDALRAARTLMEGVANAPLGDIAGPAVKVSVGVALVLATDLPESIDDLNKAAEEALVENGQKHHGTARLAPSNDQPVPPHPIDQWLCLVSASASLARPFSNPWLNMLSEDVAQAVVEAPEKLAIADAVQRFVDWAIPTWTAGLGAGGEGSVPSFSPTEVAMAAAHGILAGGLRVTPGMDGRLLLAHSALLDSVQLLLEGEPDPLVRLGEPMVVGASELPIVDHFFSATPDETARIDCRRAVLLAVGRGQIPVPEHLFREVIRVDDRPTRQGGLPDFWAAALAQLIGRCERSPNVSAVFVYGDRANAHETVRWIEERANWPAQTERLIRKTGVTARALLAASQQLKDLLYCASAEELLAAVHGVQRSGGALAPELDTSVRSQTRVLHREVKPELFRLPDAAGCRVDRVADAYPVVLDRLRSADRAVYQVRDEAGLELVEFRDFIIKVSDIGADKIPQAYSEDAADLADYYQAEFLGVGGTFTSALEAQSAVVVAGLRSVLQRSPTSTTRRGVLVIPHDVSSGEMNPLGLVAVRVSPRMSGSSTCLDFSFIWRTVEAVVGLPYSLYGSARYAEGLRDRLATPPMVISTGSLTYIALSLHMRLDDYSQQVARRVVEDESD